MTPKKRYRPFATILLRNLFVTYYNVYAADYRLYCDLHAPEEDKRIEKEVTENIVEYLRRG